MKIKVNKSLPGYAAGATVTVKTDADGIPLDRFWRDRLRDSEIDDCVEIIKSKTKPAPKKESSKEDS